MPETLTLNWRKSRYSGPRTQDCVEVADLPVGAAVRDSKHPERGHLSFGTREWRAFLTEVKNGSL